MQQGSISESRQSKVSDTGAGWTELKVDEKMQKN